MAENWVSLLMTQFNVHRNKFKSDRDKFIEEILNNFA